MRVRKKAVSIIVLIAFAAAFLLPVIPSSFSTALTITCSGASFPCHWNVANRVPSQGRATYHLYSSLTSFALASGWGLQCSPDIGGCWLGNPNTSSIQTNSTNPCVIAGQPAGMYLRIVSDDIGAPIAGAQVTAIHKQASDTCDGVLYPGQTTTTSFTTNGTTAWYSLDDTNDGSYSFVVQYSGHTYNFSAGMGPIILTCAALYIPSGRTNVTSTQSTTSCR